MPVTSQPRFRPFHSFTPPCYPQALNAESGAQPKPRKSKKKDGAAGQAGEALDKKQPPKTGKTAAVAKPGKASKKAPAGGAGADGNGDGVLSLAAAAADDAPPADVSVGPCCFDPTRRHVICA